MLAHDTPAQCAEGGDPVASLDRAPEGYIAGLGRDWPHPRLAHLYHGSFTAPGLPMCRFGWNRDDGQSYSIWRGNTGGDGICRICLRRAIAGLSPVPRKAVIQ